MANSVDPDEMPHKAAFSSGSALFANTKLIFREKKYFGKLYTVNGPSSLYCIKLNKTWSAVFLYCRFSLFLKDPFFQII